MILAVTMLAVSLFSFTTSAMAIDNVLSFTEQHIEILYDFSVVDLTQDLTFNVPYDGFYIIQTLGFPSPADGDNGTNTMMSLKDSANQPVGIAHGQTGKGYGRGRLIHCELLTNETYTLHMVFSGAEAARLLITHAEAVFDVPSPISSYTDITSYLPTNIEFVFTASNKFQAQVALIEYGDTDPDPGQPTISGSDFARGFIYDPRLPDYMGCYEIGSSMTMEWEPNVPYLLVVFIQQGDQPFNPVEELIITVSF